ncbi:Wzz/FepE/Etk N-terminal domain-containing protein [Luteibacter sp. 9135]|uniref:Wzz/FepE/Etk N-terminal domain-containing protein n=1 Tax=Luteibacter sp. 9135 TaxID=1500893 RepID=UPI000690A6EF|nr:Wzz/FepE/Etk N-terminal domain-containing protein [Luteibacter sp. 9135]
MEPDDIYLIDLWRLLCRRWRWVLGTLVLVLGLTFAYTRVARSQWEASGWIQIGQIAPTPSGQDPKIETLLRTIERLQTRAFQDAVTTGAGLAVTSPEASLYRASLKFDPEPYANLIRIKVRGYSARQAGDLAYATANALAAVHRQIGELPLRMAHQHLDDIRKDLRIALDDRDRLTREAAAGGTSGGMAAIALSRKDDDIRGLQQAESDMVARLIPNYTFDTSMPWPVYVPADKVSPHPLMIWAIGLVIGLLLGCGVAVARDAAVRARRVEPNAADTALTGPGRRDR